MKQLLFSNLVSPQSCPNPVILSAYVSSLLSFIQTMLHIFCLPSLKRRNKLCLVVNRQSLDGICRLSKSAKKASSDEGVENLILPVVASILNRLFVLDLLINFIIAFFCFNLAFFAFSIIALTTCSVDG